MFDVALTVTQASRKVPRSAGKKRRQRLQRPKVCPLHRAEQAPDGHQGPAGRHGAVAAAHICSRACSSLCVVFVSARVATLHPIEALAVTLYSDSASRHLKNQHWKIHGQPSPLYLFSLPLTLCGTSFLPRKFWSLSAPSPFSPHQVRNES